jgi:NAD(P)-dependent dehydrogenase (short-subunit alcohol dehydrogenase family)
MATANGRKSIFISGAASGIGLACAKRFAQAGWFIGLSDIDAPALAKALEAIGPDNGMTVSLDVRHRADWDKALKAFAATTDGKMDALLNNAGICMFGPFDEIDMDQCDLLVAININGVFNGASAALPYLKATPGSVLINLASSASIYGSPHQAVYAASKFAVRGFSEAIDVEFARFGVRVACIMPGLIDTPLLDKSVTRGGLVFRDAVSERVKDTPEEVARVIFESATADELFYTVGDQAHGAYANIMPNHVRTREGYRARSLAARAAEAR